MQFDCPERPRRGCKPTAETIEAIHAAWVEHFGDEKAAEIIAKFETCKEQAQANQEEEGEAARPGRGKND